MFANYNQFESPMYSLRLHCTSEQAQYVIADLWEAGTIGVRELEYGNKLILIAGFETNSARESLLQHFAPYKPEWEREMSTDWAQVVRESWPPRNVGDRLFLAPPWCGDPTPADRLRVVHNPGLACGTGEHPCTQLALKALEDHIQPGDLFIDIGTGSGILAIAALRLGASTSVGVDLDEAALSSACENFRLNGLAWRLVCGSADAFAPCSADLVVANIDATVLLSILDDLIKIVRHEGHLILTGYTEHELPVFGRTYPVAKTYEMNEWRCLAAEILH